MLARLALEQADAELAWLRRGDGLEGLGGHRRWQPGRQPPSTNVDVRDMWKEAFLLPPSFDTASPCPNRLFPARTIWRRSAVRYVPQGSAFDTLLSANGSTSITGSTTLGTISLTNFLNGSCSWCPWKAASSTYAS